MVGSFVEIDVGVSCFALSTVNHRESRVESSRKNLYRLLDTINYGFIMMLNGRSLTLVEIGRARKRSEYMTVMSHHNQIRS